MLCKEPYQDGLDFRGVICVDFFYIGLLVFREADGVDSPLDVKGEAERRQRS